MRDMPDVKVLEILSYQNGYIIVRNQVLVHDVVLSSDLEDDELRVTVSLVAFHS